MRSQVLVGWILLFLAAAVAIVALVRYAKRGTVEAEGVVRARVAHHGPWLVTGVAGAILVSEATGAIVYTAFAAAGMVALWTFEYQRRGHLGEVRLRTRLTPLNAFFIVAALLILGELAWSIASGWGEPAGFNLRHHVAPVLGLGLLHWGLSRFEVRAGGVATADDVVLPWSAIAAYHWSGKDGRRLILRRHARVPVWGDRVARTFVADEVGPIDELLAAHVTAEGSGTAASR